eukprot:scaffold26453_cov78-Skeletonema_dohrnii-CCMP3373.AAC.1
MTSSCLLFLLAQDCFVLELTAGYLDAAALQRSHVHFEVVSRRGEGPGLKRRITFHDKLAVDGRLLGGSQHR